MMVNLNNVGLIGFQSLLYVIFIIEKKFRTDDTAKNMQISTDSLYRYIRGERIIPPDRIIDLINVTKEIRFLRFFCEPTGYIPITKVQAKDLDGSIQQKEINLSIFVGQSIEKIEKAHEDKIITKQEYKDIHQSLIRLQELEATLDEQIKQEVK